MNKLDILKFGRCLSRDVTSDQLMIVDDGDSSDCASFNWFNDGLFRSSDLCLAVDRFGGHTTYGKRLYFYDCASVSEQFVGKWQTRSQTICLF